MGAIRARRSRWLGERLLAVVCDGRTRRDAGMTLPELADALVGLGATDALNLDGGGSASLVHDGRLCNRPREQHGVDLLEGRPIVTAIAFDASRAIARAAAGHARPGSRSPGRGWSYSRAVSMALRVVSAILFSPRGGSAHVARALAEGSAPRAAR